MSYQPRPGDIGLTQISGVVGKAIRFGQWLNGDGFKDYEHAFVVVTEAGTASSDETIVEAMPGGAVHVSNYHEAVYLRCPDEHRERVARAALNLVGTPYSFVDYLSIAALRLHRPSGRLRDYGGATHHMICSQLADFAAEAGGWQLFADGRWPGDVTPGDLYRLYEDQV